MNNYIEEYNNKDNKWYKSEYLLRQIGKGVFKENVKFKDKYGNIAITKFDGEQWYLIDPNNNGYECGMSQFINNEFMLVIEEE